MDQQRRPQIAQDLRRLARALRPVGGDPRVAGLARAHRGVERAHRLVQRRVGVEAVRVEDVDVVQAHPPQALIEAREQVLARAPLPVGARPHVVARLRRDDQLVAVAGEVLVEDASEVDLRAAVGRAVVVGEIEVGDAEIERAPHDRAAGRERPVIAEVLPQP